MLAVNGPRQCAWPHVHLCMCQSMFAIRESCCILSNSAQIPFSLTRHKIQQSDFNTEVVTSGMESEYNESTADISTAVYLVSQ
jgi:hypothetical protein